MPSLILFSLHLVWCSVCYELLHLWGSFPSTLQIFSVTEHWNVVSAISQGLQQGSILVMIFHSKIQNWGLWKFDPTVFMTIKSQWFSTCGKFGNLHHNEGKFKYWLNLSSCEKKWWKLLVKQATDQISLGCHGDPLTPKLWSGRLNISSTQLQKLRSRFSLK